MRLLGSTKKDDVPKLESADIVLVHFNLVNNSYQQASKVLCTSVPNKQLINVLPHSLTMLNTKNTEFSSIEVWLLIRIVNLLKLKIMLI